MARIIAEIAMTVTAPVNNQHIKAPERVYRKKIIASQAIVPNA